MDGEEGNASTPVELAAHHAAYAATGPDFAIGVDGEFDDRVVPDLPALADAVEAAVARQRIAIREPRRQRRVRRDALPSSGPT